MSTSKHFFNTFIFWKYQDRVTVFHGTSLENYHKIAKEGLKVSEEGYTKGKSFFSTSPKQADMYSRMGGEVVNKGEAVLPAEDCIVIVFSINPDLLTPTSIWLKERERFDMVNETMLMDSMFDPMGEFYTEYNIPPSCIIDTISFEEDKSA